MLAGVEKRIKAYVLMVGSSDITEFIRSSPHPNAVQTRKVLTPEQLDHSVQVLDDIAPIHYIGHAAPSALFFQNGRKDLFMPVPGVGRYHAAGSEPKLARIGPLPEGVLKGAGPENTR